jgi:hypothetical protein
VVLERYVSKTYSVLGRDTGVSSRGMDLDADVQVAFLSDTRDSECTAVLVGVSSTFVNDHCEIIFPICFEEVVGELLGTLSEEHL